jgi:hypothetical protein
VDYFSLVTTGKQAAGESIEEAILLGVLLLDFCAQDAGFSEWEQFRLMLALCHVDVEVLVDRKHGRISKPFYLKIDGFL